MESVLNGPCHLFRRINLSQGHDLTDMVKRIHPAVLHLTVIFLCLSGEAQKTHENLLVPGSSSLGQKDLWMIRMFIILTPVIASHMAGHQFVLMIKAKAILVEFHR